MVGSTWGAARRYRSAPLPRGWLGASASADGGSATSTQSGRAGLARGTCAGVEGAAAEPSGTIEPTEGLRALGDLRLTENGPTKVNPSLQLQVGLDVERVVDQGLRPRQRGAAPQRSAPSARLPVSSISRFPATIGATMRHPSPRRSPQLAAAIASLQLACAPTDPLGHTADDPERLPREAGGWRRTAADPASVGLRGDCVEARPDGRLEYRVGCRGARPVGASFVVRSEAEVLALCASGDWILGGLAVGPGGWDRAGLSCIRGVEGRLELDLTDAIGLRGLDEVIRVGELRILGEGEPDVKLLLGLLSVDAVELSVDRTESLHLAPELSALGDLTIDSPELAFVLPRWPIRSMASLEVASGSTLLDLDAIGDVRRIEGDVILVRSEENVDGLQHLEEIDGDLLLDGVRHNTVHSLRRLARVGGRFDLRWEQRVGPQLPNLEEVGDLLLRSTARWSHPLDWDGFPRLQRVHGDLSISSRMSAALSGFTALEEVDGSLSLAGVGALSGLTALHRVGGDVTVYQGTNHRAPLLPSLVVVGGTLYGDDRHGLYTFPALQELGSIDQRGQRASFALPAVHTVHGDVLPDFPRTLSFGGIKSIGGTLLLGEGAPLPAGMEALRNVGAIEVGRDYAGPLTFPNLDRIGRLSVFGPTYGWDVPDLEAIDLPALRVATTIDIGLSEGLRQISLPALHTVEADLLLSGGHEVELLELGALEQVDGALALEHLAALDAVSLPVLRGVGGDLRLGSSGAVEALSLPALEAVGGTLDLEGNPRLIEISGLGVIRALGGLRVTDNDRLFALPELAALSAVEGDLVLDRNRRLGEISGLWGLRSVGGALQITDNGWLPIDEIDSLIDGLDAAPGGGTTVRGNRP